MHEDPGQEVGGVEALLGLAVGPGGAVVPGLAPVLHLAAAVPAHPLEADGRPEDVPRKPFYPTLVLSGSTRTLVCTEKPVWRHDSTSWKRSSVRSPAPWSNRSTL